jgi:hypothetical protein
VDETFETLSLALHRVQLAQFPNQANDQLLESVHCAAINLLVAVTEFVSVALEHLTKGLAGMPLDFFSKPQEISSAACSKDHPSMRKQRPSSTNPSWRIRLQSET